MTDSSPPSWFVELLSDIEGRIERTCSLYPAADRRLVLAAVVSALHRRASEIDPSDTWLHIALENAHVPRSDIGRLMGDPISKSAHPSFGDAEDVAEDISLIDIPDQGTSSPLVAVRAAVHVAWTRFASGLDSLDRARLAAEAAHLA